MDDKLCNVCTKIDHGVLLDMIRVTMLIYNYGKNIKIDDNNEDETNIETFVSNLKNNGEFDNIDMNDTRKKALTEVADNVPSGKLCCFIDKRGNHL